MTLRVVREGQPAYDRARRALSASAVVPDHRPAVIAYAEQPADVAQALALAAAEGLAVTVRSGGHSLCFAALREGALALSVEAMDRVDVDRDAGTAVAGPGVTSLALARALRGTGWCFPLGHKSDVALGGYLLAGGNGWNQGRWGSAMESVTAADVVLADGRSVRIDAHSDPEAFALLRGAGPAFPGVVTAFHLRLWPEPSIHRRGATYPACRVAEVAGWADRLTDLVGPDVELTVFLSPPSDGSDQVSLSVSATSYGAGPDDAVALLDVLGGTMPPAPEETWDSPSDLPTMLQSQTLPPTLAMVSQQAWSDARFAELLPPVAAAVATAPSPLCSVLVSAASYRRAAPPATDAAYLPLGTMTVAPYASWVPDGDPATVATHRAWVGEVVDSVRGHWTGHYVGEVDLLATPERLAACFRPGVLDRVAALRARLDPGGRFAGYPC